jgi:hypothetical protein
MPKCPGPSTTHPLEVEYRPIETLIPFSGNARTHSTAQIAKLAAAMRRFGNVTPVLISADGTQPPKLRLRTLLKSELPLAWSDQRAWFARLRADGQTNLDAR